MHDRPETHPQRTPSLLRISPPYHLTGLCTSRPCNQGITQTSRSGVGCLLPIMRAWLRGPRPPLGLVLLQHLYKQFQLWPAVLAPPPGRAHATGGSFPPVDSVDVALGCVCVPSNTHTAVALAAWPGHGLAWLRGGHNRKQKSGPSRRWQTQSQSIYISMRAEL